MYVLKQQNVQLVTVAKGLYYCNNMEEKQGMGK